MLGKGIKNMTLEKDIQKNLIQVFQKLGYEHIGSQVKLNGHSPKLDDNFKQEIKRLNKNSLQGQDLSDSEFQRLRNSYPKNHKDAFSILRNGVSIILDDNRKIHLDFIDKHNISNNVFQIADEVTIVGGKTNRLDLVILINGIPISNIEIKKPSVTKGVEQAIAQINRYSNDGIYKQDLLNFIQLFAATNGVMTKYFSVDTRVERGNASYGEFAFPWMNKHNKLVNKPEDFVNEFFAPDHFIKVLFHYMLMKPLPNEQIMVMRPYQIHAVNAIIKTLEKGLGFDTYISASTGSGKTLTSFKLAEILSSRGKKVIMLLDRNDLAEQTTKEFKQFDANGLIKDLVKGKNLQESLANENDRLVITTIQSFNIYLTDGRNKKDIKNITDARDVVIIVDECHRSTSEKMFANIKRAFWDDVYNILKCHLVGFTGTPLLEENAKKVNHMTQLTFGEVSHIYTITEAIRDGSVNPFKLFSINFEQNNTTNYDKKEENKRSAYFNNPLRIEANANEILKQFKNHTLQINDVRNEFTGGFTAMTAAESKSAAYQYWKIFHKEFANQNRKTAIVFSLEPNKMWNETNMTEYDVYETILKDYDTDFNTNFVEQFYKDPEEGRMAHLTDVVKRSKKGEIDMLVVSDMLLTGYDNKLLNTIYLDKSLQTHGLLQAASRTNRLAGEKKKFGNVVLFGDRNMEDAFNESIKLFGSAVNIEEIIDKTSFKEMEKRLRKAVFELRELASDPNDVSSITSSEDLKEVIKAYNAVNNNLNNIMVYPEWNDKDGFAKAGISRDELDYYYGNIDSAKSVLFVHDPDDDNNEEFNPDFVVSTIDGDVIGYQYILKLLDNFVASPPEERERWLRRCEEILKNANDQEIIQNKSAIERVLQMVKNETIQTTDDLFEQLDIEIKKERMIIFENFAKKLNLPYEIVNELIDFKISNDKSMSKLSFVKVLNEYDVRSNLSASELRNFSGEVLEQFDTLAL